MSAPEYSASTVADLALMVAHALPQWHLPPQTTASLINLSENATFMLHDPSSHGEWVLRVHRTGYSSAEEIRSELAWIEALLRDDVIETAAPLVGSDGERVQVLQSQCGNPLRYAVLFQRLSGREPSLGAHSEMWFERLGRLTARLHAHAKVWERPLTFCRKRWDIDAMVGERGVWGPWRAAMGLSAAGELVIERALVMIRERLARFGMAPERFGLVHADLRLANLLVDADRLRVIDFDDCGFSWFIYDFAAAASFIEHEPSLPALKRAWIAGYRAIAPLASDDEAEIPTFVVLRRILLTAWLASHAEVELAQRLGATYTAGTVRLAQRYVSGEFQL